MVLSFKILYLKKVYKFICLYFKKFILKFKEIFLQRKRVLQYLLTISLLILGLAIYFTLTDEKEKARNGRLDYVNKDLVAGVNLYRLENYERAEVLLKRSLESAKGKKTKSFAALYLGNIRYEKGNYTDALELFRESLSYNKKNIFAMYNTALSYLKLGNTSQALRHALKTFELQNDYLPNLLLLGNIYYGAGKYEKALSIYNTIESDEAVLKINKAFTYLNLNNTDLAKSLFKVVIDDPEADIILKGIGYYTLSYVEQHNDGVKAAGYMRAALKIFPSSPVLRYNLSLLLYKQKEYRESVTLLKSIAGKLWEGEFNTLFGSGLFRSGDLEEALGFYTMIYDRTADASIAYILGDIYVNLNDLKMAMSYYESALEDPENEGALRNLIRIYLKEERYDEAALVCNDFIARDENRPLPYICLSDVYFNINRNAEARQMLEKAVFYAKDDLHYLLMAAELFQKNGFFSNALQLYHKMLSIDSVYNRAYSGIAEIYMHTGHIEKTRNILLRVINNIENEDIYYRLSIILAEAENNLNAVGIYNELIRDFPYRHEAYYNLSLKYIEIKEFEKAIQIINACLENNIGLNQSDLSYLYTISGVAHHSIGHIQKATRAFKFAFELDEGNELSFMNLRMIE